VDGWIHSGSAVCKPGEIQSASSTEALLALLCLDSPPEKNLLRLCPGLVPHIYNKPW